MSGADGRRQLLPLDLWPLADREAWAAAIAEGDILDGCGLAAHWASATRRTNVEHYARWLAFLKHTGLLDRYGCPEARVTPDRVRDYIVLLQARIAPRTVVSALVGLKVMLKAMVPGRDWRWLAKICNRLNTAAKPRRDKRPRMRPTGEIYAAAIGELERLLGTPLACRLERVAYRDGLMLALLAARPVRLKNFASIQIGRHLLQADRTWSLVFPGDEVKNRQPLEFGLPRELVPFLQIYLECVRPSFLEPSMPDGGMLWLTFEGAALKPHSIYYRFILVTRRLLGVEINPHLLRDCAATSLSTLSPAAARSAAAFLGHRHFTTTERNYIRADRLAASRKVNAILSAIQPLPDEQS